VEANVAEGTAQPSRNRNWQHLTPERRAEILESAVAARRRQGTDNRIDRVAERAGELTPAQIERLRSLLPDPGPDKTET
jgi:hypothetical protein